MSYRIENAEFVGSFVQVDQLPRDRRPQVAVAGKSNVGKSSLLNRLMGRKGLAKVSGTPGKTRTINLLLINNRFYLVDLPGYGYAKVSDTTRASWKTMIHSYVTGADSLTGMILLIDSRRTLSDDDRLLMKWLAKRSLPGLIAVTKSDKVNRDDAKKQVRLLESETGLRALETSASEGTGKRELLSALFALVEQRTLTTTS